MPPADRAELSAACAVVVLLVAGFAWFLVAVSKHLRRIRYDE